LNRRRRFVDYGIVRFAHGEDESQGGETGMKNSLSFRAALALSLAAALMMAAAPARAEKRVALVVGNNDYKNVPKLQKAVNDARTMGDTLKQLSLIHTDAADE
jgi:ABC-type sugar transport system substrate-binding protein